MLFLVWQNSSQELFGYIHLNFSDKDGNKLNPATIGMPPGIPEPAMIEA